MTNNNSTRSKNPDLFRKWFSEGHSYEEIAELAKKNNLKTNQGNPYSEKTIYMVVNGSKLRKPSRKKIEAPVTIEIPSQNGWCIYGSP